MLRKKIFWLSGLLICIIFGALFFSNYSNTSETNQVTVEKKYANFQEINKNYNSANFKVKLLTFSTYNSAEAPTPIRAYQSVNGDIIVITDTEDKSGNDEIRMYKIDPKGNVTDFITMKFENAYPDLVGNFMFFIDAKQAYYNIWPKNGDLTKQEMTRLNSDFTWKQDKISEVIRETINNGGDYFFDSYSEGGNTIKQFYFYKDEKWQIISEKMTAYYDPDFEETIEKFSKEVFYTGEDSPYLDDLQLLNFHKEKKITYDHITGGGSGFSTSNWRGTGFFRTIINNKNFNFAVKDLVIEKEKHDSYKNRYYIVPDDYSYARHLDARFYVSPNGFALFSADSRKLFLISP